MRKGLTQATLVLAITLVPTVFCFGQTQVMGKISGTIEDSTGAVMANVKVTATNTGTALTRTTTTDAAGYYALSNLPGGTYDIRAEETGFKACIKAGVILDPAGSVQVGRTMEVGAVTQTVEVSGAALTVQTEDSKVQQVLSSTQILEMPVNGRNFASLLALQPGMVQAFSFNSNQSMNVFATQDTHVNGMRGDANNVLIDGSPSTRARANGAMVAPPSIDAIGEINTVTTGYMPEYSRGAGGQLVVQMKSGAQQYHGGAYEFMRNDALDSRNFFDSSVSPLKLNNFGYDIGGPVIPHGRKLFFWDQEWSRNRTSSVTTATVPSALVRTGNFSEYCAAGLPCPTVPTYLDGVQGLVAGQRFPANTIPPSLWSQNGSSMVLAMGTPTSAGLGTNFVHDFRDDTNNRVETAKVDYMPSDKWHIAVSIRHQAHAEHQFGQSAGSSGLLQWEIQLPERGATADVTTNFSPTLMNDFTFTATEDIVHVLLPGGAGLDRTALGINFPYIFGDASKDIAAKIPTVNVSGFDSISGQPYPSGSVGKVFTFQDVLTKFHGKHLIKLGLWVEQDGENDHDQVRVTPGSASGIGNNLNGTFTFDASNLVSTTGAPLGDAFLGNFGAYSELGWRNYTPWVSWQEGVFAQDSWKVTPRLTVNYGLRWDYFPPYHSRWCNFASFDPLNYSTLPGVKQVVDPSTGFVTGGNPYNGIAVPCQQIPTSAIGHFAVFGQPLTAGNYDTINQKLRNDGMQKGFTPEIFQKHYDNFQPRLGFAWDPMGKGTTSIRGSAGIFYNHFTLSDVTLMGGNSPFQLAAETIGGKADCPGGAVDARRSCLSSTGGAIPQLPIPITGGDLVSQIPEIYQWSFTVQHEFPQDTLVEVGYVGTRAKHLVLNADENQLVAGTKTDDPVCAAQPAACFRYSGLGGLTVGLNQASSKYDALQVSAQRRLHAGLQFGLAYTFSNTFDYGSDLYANAIDTYNIKYNYGPADWGRRNLLVINSVYDLPFLKNNTTFVGKVLGGWEVANVIALESGAPVSITNSTGDVAGVNSDFGQYGIRAAGCSASNAPRDVAEWFNTSCFTNASPGTFGNAGRNSVWGPPVRNWDFALYKNGPIPEGSIISSERSSSISLTILRSGVGLLAVAASATALGPAISERSRAPMTRGRYNSA